MTSTQSGNSKNGDNSPSSSNTLNSDAPLDRIRQILLTPPSTRPPEFENPLEKIEQLLTCPICFDRYKQPKLLPCHHTFCQSCLENCADIVRRILKCPECRAEHPLPYDGIKNLQTNYTLIGFLDVHIQATDDNAEQLEAYIHRYNLERCKICDEKAVLEVCAHCERRACADCRNTHMDMLKRDLSRMLNQVKRLSSRIIEASDGLSKGADLLTLNCETAKDEVHEYFRRYYRELKKREDMFIQEIDTFHANETRLMRNLRDVLEIEISNVSEGCTYLEAALKGEREVQDTEFAKLKNIFGDGLEYLRNFQPDADELFSKKLRFSPGDDASKLPNAIANFGELTVSLPQFAGRYLPLEHSYLPRPMRIGYESDNCKFSRRNDIDDNRSQSDARSLMRHSRNNDDDIISTRLRRRQIEEEAWNRLRMGNLDNGRQSPNNYIPGNNPWSRSVVPNASAISNENSSENRNNPCTFGATENFQSHNQGSFVNAFESTQFLPEQPTVLMVPTTDRVQRDKEITELKTNNITKAFVKSQETNVAKNMKNVTQNMTMTRQRRTPIPTIVNTPNAQISIIETQPSSHTPTFETNQVTNLTNNENIDPQIATGTCSKMSHKAPLPRQFSSDDMSLNEKIESIRAAHEKRRELKNIESLPEQATKTTIVIHSSEESESDNDQSPPVLTGNRFRIICRSQTSIDSSFLPKLESKLTKNEIINVTASPSPNNVPVLASVSELTAPACSESAPSPIPIQHYPGETPSWLARRRQRYQRSKTNPDLASAIAALSSHASSFSSAASPNTSRIQQLLFERSNRLESSLLQRFQPTLRQESLENSTSEAATTNTQTYTSNIDISTSACSDRRSRYRKRSSAVEREKSSDARISLMRSPRFICSIDYQSKNKPKFVFGKKGSKEGELNWPRGITTISGNEFAVCDSSNHRVCIFNTQGRLIKIFGKYGTGDGELDSAADICCNRMKQLIVSDRYNHRIMIFDQNGQFIRKFGGHGPSNGRFNNPWGVAIDDSGLIHIADKDNHRIQIFDLKGQFLAKFGITSASHEDLYSPQFIAIHKRTQNVYVTDSSNHRVCVFDHNGNPLFQFGQEGYRVGEMKNPRGIAVDEQGFIVVADSGNNRVQIFYPDGRFMYSFGAWGTAPGQMKGIEAVALLEDTIIVSDRENHRIQLF